MNSIPNKIVLIGASTGGPGQIQKIITALPILEATTFIIAQHMVQGFVPSFAHRLQEYTKNNLLLITDKLPLDKGNIYICEGDVRVEKNYQNLIFTYSPSEKNSYNPNISTLFNSLVPFADSIKIMCVILTGIGEDGVDGCQNLDKKGSICVTQTKESAIVDGMTSRARETVPNIKILNLAEIQQTIKEFCN